MRKAYPPLARSILWSPCGESFRLLPTTGVGKTQGMGLFVEQCALAAAAAHARSTEPDTAVGLLLGRRYLSRSDRSRFDVVEAIAPAATIPETADMRLDELLAALRTSAPTRGRDTLGWYCSPLPTDRGLSAELEAAHSTRFGESAPWVLALDREYGANTQGMFFIVDPHERRSCRAPFCESFARPAPAYDPVWLSCSMWDGYWTRDMVLPLDNTARDALVPQGVHGGAPRRERPTLLQRVVGRRLAAGEAIPALFPAVGLDGPFSRGALAEPARARGEVVVPREVAHEPPPDAQREVRREPPRAPARDRWRVEPSYEAASAVPPEPRWEPSPGAQREPTRAPAREQMRGDAREVWPESPREPRDPSREVASVPPPPSPTEPERDVPTPVVADDARARPGDMHAVARRRLFELTGTEMREPEPRTETLPVPRARQRSALALPSRMSGAEPAQRGVPPLVAAAQREGFELVAQFHPSMRSAHPEELWVLHSPELGALVEVLVVDDVVADASIHYNLREADAREMADAFEQHRDLATRTIYRRESCVAGVTEACRRLRERDAPSTPWTVSPQLYLLTPGEWTHFAATARTGRDAAARVYELAIQRMASLPDAVRRQLGAALAAIAAPGAKLEQGANHASAATASAPETADVQVAAGGPATVTSPIEPDAGVTGDAR